MSDPSVHQHLQAAWHQRETDHQAHREQLLELRMQESSCSAFHPRNREICVKQMGSVPPILAEAIAGEIFKARIATSNQQFEIQAACTAAAKMLADWLEEECAGSILDSDLDLQAEH